MSGTEHNQTNESLFPIELSTQQKQILAGIGVAIVAAGAGYFVYRRLNDGDDDFVPGNFIKTVTGLGNPLLDISVQCETDELFQKYGLLPDNAILAEESHMPLFDELLEMDPEFIAGGACLNSIRACQWMLNDQKRTFYIGCVGDDENGRNLMEHIRNDNVTGDFQIITEEPTGRCGVLVHNKERSLVSSVGAARCFTSDFLETRAVKKVLAATDIFYVCGFFLDSSPESVLRLGKYASENNKVFVFNISAVFVTEVYLDEMNETLKYADIVICNEGEAFAFAKSQGWETTDLSEIGRKITELPKSNSNRDRVAIITCGRFLSIH
eukprot:TRINITY_DN2793_c0_g1_i1.p1 TRINITY_DN2793_c0_g1~~TRINITY_DN2793_c0_g1_i1.p1  ORF type:complete len:325 (-),score=83.93 TRINITY_DN2793_c0_g1_i1:542-1516(-)